MKWLNYHHLLYFWMVAREGGLAPAGRILRLAHPTLSNQIRALEEQLGEKLFKRVGRRLTLTEAGTVVFRYAEDIFTLGNELVHVLEKGQISQNSVLNLGIVDAVPKMLVRSIIEPACSLPHPTKLICYEGSLKSLMHRLASHTIDVIIADGPAPNDANIPVYDHLVADSGLSFLGHKKYHFAGKKFPDSLQNSPMLLPLRKSTLGQAIYQWLASIQITPHVIAECEDSSLAKALGADGMGIFTAPTAVEKDIIKRYNVITIGRTEAIRERVYIISPERKIKNPAVIALCKRAKEIMFL